jgi:hypothetical protein
VYITKIPSSVSFAEESPCGTREQSSHWQAKTICDMREGNACQKGTEKAPDALKDVEEERAEKIPGSPLKIDSRGV